MEEGNKGMSACVREDPLSISALHRMAEAASIINTVLESRSLPPETHGFYEMAIRGRLAGIRSGHIMYEPVTSEGLADRQSALLAINRELARAGASLASASRQGRTVWPPVWLVVLFLILYILAKIAEWWLKGKRAEKKVARLLEIQKEVKEIEKKGKDNYTEEDEKRLEELKKEVQELTDDD